MAKRKSTVLLEHCLKQLKLPTIGRDYAAVASICGRENASFETFLLRLCERELTERQQRAMERRIKAAKFPTLKTIESFKFDDQPDINEPLIRELLVKGEADHFIPWSKYPQDLGHNFVLAHSSCNNRKSDYLAAEEHLGAWRDRNASVAGELSQRFDALELPHDMKASIRVAEWAYGQTEKAEGQVWVRDRILKHLQPDWRRFLAAG